MQIENKSKSLLALLFFAGESENTLLLMWLLIKKYDFSDLQVLHLSRWLM